MYKLFFISFLLYFILVFQIPTFVGDEGYYSISITDAINNGIQPYLLFFSVPAFWKPPLMVDVYTIIAIPFIELFNMDIVYAYRIGSVIFSTLNVILVYLISKEFIDKEKAKWITIVYTLNPIILIFGTKIFMETMAMTFVFLGVLGAIKYTKENMNIWLALIPLSIFGASYTKSFTIGIMSILLCGLYFLLFNLKKIDKFIIAVIIGIVLCILFAWYSGFPEVYYKLLIEDFFTTRMQSMYIDNVFSTLATLFYLIPLFLVGWKKIDIKDKKDIFMLIWFLPLIPIMIKTPFVWYAFYFVLPIVYLALKGIDVKGFDLFIIIILIFIGLIIMYQNYEGHKKLENVEIEKYISENINKNECIWIMGTPEMMLYSYLYNEKYNFNFILNGGYLPVNGTRISYHYFTENQVDNMINNYKIDETCIEKKQYLYLDASNAENNYFKSCNINCEKPKYVLITSKPEIKLNCEIIKEFSNLIVWKC